VREARAFAAATFPIAAMVPFDLLSRRRGVWTAVTAATYGLLGLGFAFVYSALLRRGRTAGAAAYLASGVVGVLAFDFVTGPVLSSLLFQATSAEALVGQIRFTAKHLLSVSGYASIVSPAPDAALRQIERGEKAIERKLEAMGHPA
jgi:hypothetical protein